MERTIQIRFTAQYVDVTSPMAWAKEHLQLTGKVSIDKGFDNVDIQSEKEAWMNYNKIGYFFNDDSNKLLLDIDTPLRTVYPDGYKCVMKKCNEFIDLMSEICTSPAHAIMHMKKGVEEPDAWGAAVNTWNNSHENFDDIIQRFINIRLKIKGINIKVIKEFKFNKMKHNRYIQLIDLIHHTSSEDVYKTQKARQEKNELVRYLNKTINITEESFRRTMGHRVPI